MKSVIIVNIILLLSSGLNAQKKAEEFGYAYYPLNYDSATVDILVKFKNGENRKKKPIFFSIQGSLAKPLIVHDGRQLVSYTTLSEGFVEDDFHLVMVGKPGIPLMSHRDSLIGKGGKAYKNPITHQYPTEYLANNNLEYYVRRNSAVLDFLKKQDWVDTTQIVIAGHSEGSTIAAHMANKISGITHLIYSGGLPYYSRILAMVQQERRMESVEENPWVQKSFDYWQDVVDHPFALIRHEGWNTNTGTYSFSQNENEILKRLKIPVLICYGTNDEAGPFNDMFHIEAIRDRAINISFKAYVGLNHNYFGLKANQEVDFEKDNIEKVVTHWLKWIEEN